MKQFNNKLSFIAACLAMLNGPDADAVIRRVGYNGTNITGVDYTSLQVAHNAAAAGDTIYMYPGTHNNFSTTLTKRLVIIGHGYLLDPANGGNSGLQQGTGTTLFTGTIVLSAGSDSTYIMGIDNLVVNISASGKHIIKRNSRVSVSIGGTAVDKVQLLQNWGLYVAGGATGQSITSVNISNNIGVYADLNVVGCTYSGIIQNNVFTGTGGGVIGYPLVYPSIPNSASACIVKNMVVQNNIFGDFGSIGPSATAQSTGCVFQNNIFRGASTSMNLATGGNTSLNNQFGINLTTGYFVGGTTGSYDSRFALAPASPAIGAGIGGVDIGAYGGPTPYKLSGIPTIPTIYLITSPDGISPATSPMNFTISTRSN